MNNIEELSPTDIKRLLAAAELHDNRGSIVAGMVKRLIAQLEAAQQELIKPLPIGELVHRLEGQTYEKWFSESDVKGLWDRAEAAEAALSAANEKLSKPVVFPDYRCSPDMHTKKYYETIGFNLGLDACKAVIKTAGFTVEGE